MPVNATLTHAYLIIIIGFEISLNDLDSLTVRNGLKPLDVRILDQKFPFDLKRFRFSEERRYFRDQPFHFILKI